MKARNSYTFFDYAFTIIVALVIAVGALVIAAGLYSENKWKQAKGKFISYVGSGKELKDNVTRSTTSTTDSN